MKRKKKNFLKVLNNKSTNKNSEDSLLNYQENKNEEKQNNFKQSEN